MKSPAGFGKSLPDYFEKVSEKEEKKQQIIIALGDSFAKSIKSKHKSESNLDQVIKKLSIKEINDVLFDDEVPNANRKGYCEVIDEFLSNPDEYQSDFTFIIEGYLQTVIDLQAHIQHLLIDGCTDESDDNFRTSTADYLNARLTSICERTRLVISIHREIEGLQKDISTRKSEIGQIESKVQSIEQIAKDLDEIINTGNKKNGGDNPGIKATVMALSQKVNETKNTSDQIMPNIISLMGVFSSAIVVILTLITTSSTWLSNANETNVLIAFVVPAGIITLAICALTALIRSALETQSSKELTQPDNTKSWPNRIYLATNQFFHKWGLWIIIATVTVLILCGTTSFCQKTNNNQSHYIVKCLPTSESSDNPSEDEETQTTPEALVQELFIVQEIVLPTGEVYLDKIPCVEEDIHSDGFIYYCLLHQRFE